MKKKSFKGFEVFKHFNRFLDYENSLTQIFKISSYF